MMMCECGSDDFELLARFWMTEIFRDGIPNHYTEGIYICKFCGELHRDDGIDIGPEETDNVYSLTLTERRETEIPR